MIDLGIENKVLLITGANHGIGAATAKAFALQGVKVCIAYYRGPCKFRENELINALNKNEGGELLYRANQQKTPHNLIKEITEQHGKAVEIEKDLSNISNIITLFDFCEKELGPVDILINNHTYCSLDTFDRSSVTSDGFGINLISAENIDNNFAIMLLMLYCY